MWLSFLLSIVCCILFLIWFVFLWLFRVSENERAIILTTCAGCRYQPWHLRRFPFRVRRLKKRKKTLQIMSFVYVTMMMWSFEKKKIGKRETMRVRLNASTLRTFAIECRYQYSFTSKWLQFNHDFLQLDSISKSIKTRREMQHARCVVYDWLCFLEHQLSTIIISIIY
jgi:hypothetical protein